MSLMQMAGVFAPIPTPFDEQDRVDTARLKVVLGRWVAMLKQYLARALVRAPSPPIWQRGFFDHLLRNDESYSHKWNYVRDNPLRAGLVAKADDWPYAGEVVIIDRA